MLYLANRNHNVGVDTTGSGYRDYYINEVGHTWTWSRDSHRLYNFRNTANMQDTWHSKRIVSFYEKWNGPALTSYFANVGSSNQLFAAACIAGITTHLSYFIRGEHHRKTVQIFKTYIVVLITVAGLCVLKNVGDLQAGAMQAVIVTVAYLLGLFGSMAIYRAFLHPLCQFRGPFWAGFSNLYHSSLLKKSDNYRVVYNLHKRYGPIVRTGMLRTVYLTQGMLNFANPSSFRSFKSESQCSRSDSTRIRGRIAL